MRNWPWSVLGIEQTGDKPAIRRAYADKLKAMDIDKDIQGYEALRHARDHALRLADAPPLDDAPLLADEDGWDDADEAYDDDLEHDGDGVHIRLEDDPRWSGPNTFQDFNIGWDDLGGNANPFGYGTGDYVDPTTTVDAERQDGPDRKLARLLFPGGEYSDEAFTLEENEEAQHLLGAMIDDARAGDLSQEQAVDHWLAEMLAESWPRSAPLVEKASTTFDWLSEAGGISERPALQFLNPRLRGMRFTEKVEQPGHPLHKAWTELQRPGPHSFTDRFKVKREDIHVLLGGIRERYPEVEHHLDAERVASWEKAAPEWLSWIAQRGMFVLFAFLALRFCASGIADDPNADQIAVIPTAEQGVVAEEFVAELFGEDASPEELKAADVDLDRRVDGLRMVSIDRGQAVAIREGAYLTRYLSHRAVEKATFEDLLAIHTLRRDAARAVRAEEGDAACTEFLRSARLPDNFELSEEIRARERQLAWRLVGAGLMNPDADLGGPETAPVPGWLFDEIMRSSGSTEAQVNAEFGGKDRSRSCAIRLAMIDAMLRRPGDVPPDLLRLR